MSDHAKKLLKGAANISPQYSTAKFLSVLTGLPISYQVSIMDHPLHWIMGEQAHRFDFKGDFSAVKGKQEEINKWLKRVGEAKGSDDPMICIVNPGDRHDEVIMTFARQDFFTVREIKQDLRCAVLWQALDRFGDGAVQSVVKKMGCFEVKVKPSPDAMLGDPVTLMFDVNKPEIKIQEDNGLKIYRIPSKMVDQEIASPNSPGGVRL